MTLPVRADSPVAFVPGGWTLKPGTDDRGNLLRRTALIASTGGDTPASLRVSGQPGSSSLFASLRQPRCLRSQPTEARWYVAVSS